MIIQVLNSSESLWIPVFSLNDKVYQSPTYLLFGAFLIFFYALIAYIIIRTCTIFLSIKVFHENMNVLMAWFLLQWFEAIIAKMVIIPYQIGLISIGVDPAKTFCSWSSFEKDDILIVRDKNEIMPLYVASFFLWHYMASILFAIVAITIERGCATYFIEDYESKNRRWISVLLIIITNIITIPYSYYILHNSLSLLLSYSQGVANGTFVFVGYLMLMKVNLYWKKKMGSHDNQKYSLGRKFQIEENLRSLQLAKRLVTASLTYIAVTVLILIFSTLNIISQFGIVYVHYLDNCILLAAFVMSTTLLFCSQSWKEKFKNDIPFFRNFINSRVSNSHLLHRAFSNKESEAYFEQLKSAWA
ncbi:hypothetical protein GCK72_006694 [Caenorhabditis remanei]|uniref:Uncharacterized protein n=1 Tax=Caenorhabditis remanei TaxID=31234 RepID=A0A6A5HJ75_CAERE|nr:hypothetical protein GCK72_006694 [Caenorhabditis remanei]KAF1766736.1 hypothetical protein GCK72_006694 [Caenorhabditis remanei]